MRLINPDNSETIIEINIEKGSRVVSNIPGPPGPEGPPVASSSVHLSQAADMNMDGALPGNFVRWNGVQFYVSTMVLDDHLDVEASDPQPGEALLYNGSMWVPGAISGVTGFYVLKAGDTMTGVLDMTTHKIVGVADPTVDGDAANKKYVDAKVTAGTGTVILSGAGTPAPALGADTNYYNDITNRVLHGPKAGTNWPIAVKGVPVGGTINQVLSKTAATDYALIWRTLPTYAIILSGDGPPSDGTGAPGDYYVDKINGIMYGPKGYVDYGARVTRVGGGGGAMQPGQFLYLNNVFSIHRIDSTAIDKGQVIGRYLTPDSRIRIESASSTLFTSKVLTTQWINSETALQFTTESSPLDTWIEAEGVFLDAGASHWPVTVDLNAEKYAPAHREMMHITNTPFVVDKDYSNLFILMESSGAQVIQLPSDANTTFPMGGRVDFMWYGAGQSSFAAGSGAVVNATPGLKFRARNAVCSAFKLDTGWVVFGDLVA